MSAAGGRSGSKGRSGRRWARDAAPAEHAAPRRSGPRTSAPRCARSAGCRCSWSCCSRRPTRWCAPSPSPCATSRSTGATRTLSVSVGTGVWGPGPPTPPVWPHRPSPAARRLQGATPWPSSCETCAARRRPPGPVLAWKRIQWWPCSTPSTRSCPTVWTTLAPCCKLAGCPRWWHWAPPGGCRRGRRRGGAGSIGAGPGWVERDGAPGWMGGASRGRGWGAQVGGRGLWGGAYGSEVGGARWVGGVGRSGQKLIPPGPQPIGARGEGRVARAADGVELQGAAKHPAEGRLEQGALPG